MYTVLMRTDPSRARTAARRAIRAEVAAVAERLFLTQGYDATTIDAIAAEAGMSPRSVYRYFPTKDDILIDRFARISESLSATLQSRPAAEPLWDSLAASFRDLVEHADRSEGRDSALLMQRAIISSPVVFGRYLQQLQVAQTVAVRVLSERSGGATNESDDGVVVLNAIVGAAFGCLVAAQCVWTRADVAVPFAAVLERAMAAVTPSPALRE